MSHCRIGFYVHHHGQGHANRTREIIQHLAGLVYVFGSDLSLFEDVKHSDLEKVSLPLDISESGAIAQDWPSVLHYAPLGIPGIRQRVHTMVGYFDEHALDVLVVDVSVEVALLARLCGIPVIYARQHGYRFDLAHQAAFQSATSLLAPYPESWEEPEVPDWMRDKTFYAGGFSRFEHQTTKRETARQLADMQPDRQYAVVMSGFGGQGEGFAKLEEAARFNPEWQWWVIGPVPPSESPPDNLRFLGVQKNPFPYLRGADVVIAAAGNNTVTELAQLQARFICLPEPRPFDEQISKARILARKNAALVLPKWPSPARWRHHLQEVMQTDTNALGTLITPNAAQRAAQHIEEVAHLKNQQVLHDVSPLFRAP